MKYNFNDIVISNEDQKKYYLNLIEEVNSKINLYEVNKYLNNDKKFYYDKGYNEPRGFILFNIERLGD